MTDASIRHTAEEWIEQDPDPDTREAARELLAEGDEAALREHFGRRLQFGTAGLRGPLGPGPNRMNRALVRRVTAGLADYVDAQVEGATTVGVVIGFDGRHGSRAFAEDAARVLAGRGFRVWLYDEVCPTPQLAHAVTHLGTAAGIMVTASHNPPQDNGYKVYWRNGAQIIPPHDEGISAAIDAVEPIGDIPAPPLAKLRDDGRVRPVKAEVLKAYKAGVADLRVHHDTGVRVVYTPLHGVGADLMQDVLYEAGHTDLHVVEEQARPDGDFPTVEFPNPEEPGALDLALALAREQGADLVLANDPDGDRLAVAVRDDEGVYRPLTGDQIGCLLADDLLEHGEALPARMAANSMVSSTMLARIAQRHGAEFFETLTGFKWIANGGLSFEDDGGHFVFGYEEALGYSVGSLVRDKDGISAGLVLVDLAAWCKERGETLLDRLEALYRQHGCYGSAQHSIRIPGAEGREKIPAIMAALREDPPGEMDDLPLVRVRDLLRGTDRDLRTGVVSETTLPQSNVLHFEYGDDVRVLARPSGTEPKIKFYFQVRAPMGDDESLDEVASRVRARVDMHTSELLAYVDGLDL